MTGTAVATIATPPAQQLEAPVTAQMDLATYIKRMASPEQLKQQKQLMAAYDAACEALIGPNDVQVTPDGTFKKKSAWRKFARHFGISTTIVNVFGEWDPSGNFVARVIARAVAPWGQSNDEIGVCSTREARFRKASAKQKAEHDCIATASTRATNRATSNLVAMGEVSAEEVQANGGRAEQEAEPVRVTDLAIAREMRLRGKNAPQKPLGEISDNGIARIKQWIFETREERADDEFMLDITDAITLIQEDRLKAQQEAHAPALQHINQLLEHPACTDIREITRDRLKTPKTDAELATIIAGLEARVEQSKPPVHKSGHKSGVSFGELPGEEDFDLEGERRGPPNAVTEGH